MRGEVREDEKLNERVIDVFHRKIRRRRCRAL